MQFQQQLRTVLDRIQLVAKATSRFMLRLRDGDAPAKIAAATAVAGVVAVAAAVSATDPGTPDPAADAGPDRVPAEAPLQPQHGQPTVIPSPSPTHPKTHKLKPRPKPKHKPSHTNTRKHVVKHHARIRRLPTHVAGLSVSQTSHARQIIRAGKDMGVSFRGQVVAMTTALQESQLKVYANPAVPGSFDIRHDAVGYDHLSVGIFQQQVPMWGSAWGCMNPYTSAEKFYTALMNVYHWWDLLVGTAAQAVQGSAYPTYYFDDVYRAVYIVKTIHKVYY